jgi:hypothetical protein
LAVHQIIVGQKRPQQLGAILAKKKQGTRNFYGTINRLVIHKTTKTTAKLARQLKKKKKENILATSSF